MYKIILMFDSCVHAEKNNLEYLKKISKKIKSKNIVNALCMYDNEKNDKDRLIFYQNCLETENLIPVAFIRKVKNLKKEIENIQDAGFKFIKFHPRNLNIKLGNQFYIEAFKILKNTKLNIMWCTFDGWSTPKISEINQLDFLTKLTNIVNNNNIILMHAGGPNILKYYEKFRFVENIFFDLSYTLYHYRNTSVEKDIIFLFKNFDKRIVCGTDFPTISFQDHQNSLKRILGKSKISKNKLLNIMTKNLKNIYEFTK